MATTVQEFVNSTLRLIGVIASGETPSTDESNDAFATLNQLLSNWSAAAVPVYQVARDVIPLTGAANYTIAVRPVKLKSAHITTTNGVSMPVEIVTSERWSRFKDRTRTGLF